MPTVHFYFFAENSARHLPHFYALDKRPVSSRETTIVLFQHQTESQGSRNQEGRMVPPTSQQEEFCPWVSLVDKTSLQTTVHTLACSAATHSSQLWIGSLRTGTAVAKPVAATARCLNGHCSRIPSVLARVKKNGDLGGSKLFFFFFFRMRSDRHRNSG